MTKTKTIVKSNSCIGFFNNPLQNSIITIQPREG
jgi:hypothetical protein